MKNPVIRVGVSCFAAVLCLVGSGCQALQRDASPPEYYEPAPERDSDPAPEPKPEAKPKSTSTTWQSMVVAAKDEELLDMVKFIMKEGDKRWYAKKNALKKAIEQQLTEARIKLKMREKTQASWEAMPVQKDLDREAKRQRGLAASTKKLGELRSEVEDLQARLIRVEAEIRAGPRPKKKDDKDDDPPSSDPDPFPEEVDEEKGAPLSAISPRRAVHHASPGIGIIIKPTY